MATWQPARKKVAFQSVDEIDDAASKVKLSNGAFHGNGGYEP